MRVLFFISIFRHGRGGHVHSLNHIVNALSPHINAKIVTVGKERSRVLEENSCFLTHLNTRNFSLGVIRDHIHEIRKDFKPEILHFFDLNVFNLIKVLIYPKPIHVIVNKCGGANPINFAFVSHLIVFSEENRKWFATNKKFRNSRIYLIPNRVNKQELVVKRDIGIKKQVGIFTFLRICRIGQAYQKGLEDSVRMIQKLVDCGRTDVFLYIIGTVEDKSTLLSLKDMSSGYPVEYLIDDDFTKRASDMLFLADAVIATGRGLMEATALGKPILTPAINTNMPVLVTRNNFMAFFSTNFSERNMASHSDLNLNIGNILSLVDDSKASEEHSAFSKEIFSQYFDVTSGVAAYITAYKELLNSKKRIYSIFTDVRMLLKTIYNFFF